MTPAGLRRRLSRTRALVLDVDGVLTDGGLYYGDSAEPLKKFNVKDGMGLRRLQDAGVAVALVSGELSRAVLRRADKLRIPSAHVFTGVDDKVRALEDFLSRVKLDAARAAYVGDDLNDLDPMARVGVAVAVADAAPEVLKAAHWVTSRRGGEGAIREVCDAIVNSLKVPRPIVR